VQFRPDTVPDLALGEAGRETARRECVGLLKFTLPSDGMSGVVKEEEEKLEERDQIWRNFTPR
jgi:hypothetical protein